MNLPRLSQILRFLGPLLMVSAPHAADRDFPINADGNYFPTAEIPLEFPRDHGSHPGFSIEWWYITGHLSAPNPIDRRFGFQVTFFRSAAPRGVAETGTAGFSDNTVMLAHLALIDVDRQQFYHQEKLDRAGWNARASEERLDLFHGGWKLVALEYDEHGDPVVMKFHGHIRSEVELSLEFRPQKPRVLFGENGVSRKGAAPDAASYYITFTRMAVDGFVQIGEEVFEVDGQAWMDHEFSSNQLEDDLVGWDWVQMQLFDGTEVKAYRLRTEDQGTSPFSLFYWIDAEGGARHVDASHFKWIDRKLWKSPHTGGAYPIAPAIAVRDPDSGQEEYYDIVPLFESAEIPGNLGGIAYWEGPVEVRNRAGETIGLGFLELTGYADALTGRL